MSRRVCGFSLVLAALAVGGVFLVSAIAAGSGGRTTYRFQETALQATVKQSPDWPAPGSKNVTAAVVIAQMTTVGSPGSTVVHRGAYRHYNTITAQLSPTTWGLKGTGQTYFGQGSSKVKYHGTATLQPDGSVVVAGEGSIIGGTGNHRGARGRYAFRGSAPSQTAPYTVHLHGTVSY